MKHSTYTSYDELPLMLSVAEVASMLGISRAGAYELARSNSFPRAQNWQPDHCSEGQVPRMDRRKQRFQKRTAVNLLKSQVLIKKSYRQKKSIAKQRRQNGTPGRLK